MLFGGYHERLCRTPLLTRPKAVEKTQDQAMLTLTPQEKRLNAFKEFAGISREFYLNVRRHKLEH